ncbi:hypothetical protein KM043_017524 [Ampulex compressa]|nr:hypothetical protein KM043_017524 [Ampulex compressa]
MLKAAIVLWLLASIYGLEIVDVVKKDVKVPPETLKEIQKDVKEKVNYLLLHSVIDWKDTHVIFSIMHHNASLVFQKKLTRELDDVRVSSEDWLKLQDGRSLIAVIFTFVHLSG